MSSTLSLAQESGPDFSPSDTHTVPISGSAALRIYSDTKPHNWKTANLQKGLILLYNGTEMVGEGTGFGVPVLVYSDETYFSATSKVYLSHYENCWIVRKDFIMDRIARNSFKNVTLENRTGRTFFAYLANVYQRHPKFRSLTMTTKNLIRKADIDTAFVKVAPLGTVTVTYAIDKRRILVKADFKHLSREKLERIFMLNEQGSRFFRRYIDSQGTELADGKIGAWDEINAEWACLIVLQGGFGFRLWRMEDCVLRRGREFLKDSLDWVGLDYETSPKNAALEYSIEISGA